jgi:HBS1 N-terminus
MAFAQARSVLGPETSSGISDEQIKNAAWDNFFDVETTVEWLLSESFVIYFILIYVETLACRGTNKTQRSERKGR